MNVGHALHNQNDDLAALVLYSAWTYIKRARGALRDFAFGLLARKKSTNPWSSSSDASRLLAYRVAYHSF